MSWRASSNLSLLATSVSSSIAFITPCRMRVFQGKLARVTLDTSRIILYGVSHHFVRVYYIDTASSSGSTSSHTVTHRTIPLHECGRFPDFFRKCRRCLGLRCSMRVFPATTKSAFSMDLIPVNLSRLICDKRACAVLASSGTSTNLVYFSVCLLPTPLLLYQHLVSLLRPIL